MIILDYSDKRPIYEQVAEKIKNLIYVGALKADEQMPSVRSLAMDLSLNPNTVQRAYGELEREGFIYPVKGKGNYVADVKKLLPGMRKEFYSQIDSMLDSLPRIGISREELAEHIMNYGNTGE